MGPHSFRPSLFAALCVSYQAVMGFHPYLSSLPRALNPFSLLSNLLRDLRFLSSCSVPSLRLFVRYWRHTRGTHRFLQPPSLRALLLDLSRHDCYAAFGDLLLSTAPRGILPSILLSPLFPSVWCPPLFIMACDCSPVY